MKALPARVLANLRVLALLIGSLPLVVLPFLGVLWLWQHDLAVWWLALLLAFTAGGFALNRWLDRRARAQLKLELSGPVPRWPPAESAVWAQLETFANELDTEQWPLSDGAGLLRLGRRTVELVAREYHPDTRQPLLELSVPHLLRIIELAARDLGSEVREQIPLSDRLTIGRFYEMKRWMVLAEDVYGLWRTGRLVINPVNALLSEASEHFRGQAFAAVKTDIQHWLLQEYVRRTGRYAIEVYSGRLLFADSDPQLQQTPVSTADIADEACGADEPLRVLVLGQNNAGKSSLVNALFDELRAAVDVVRGTPSVHAYTLEREGLQRALVIDSPGLAVLPREQMLSSAIDADLILWVTSAHRAARAPERGALDAIREYFAHHPEVHVPPVLVVMTHIDRLRPSREWQPPYDLRDDSCTKAVNIADALAAVAEDLRVPVSDIVPVCLAEGCHYNVDDALWAAILERQSDADRARSLRCLDSACRAERSELVWRQFKNAGRVLASLPRRLR